MVILRKRHKPTKSGASTDPRKLLSDQRRHLRQLRWQGWVDTFAQFLEPSKAPVVSQFAAMLPIAAVFFGIIFTVTGSASVVPAILLPIGIALLVLGAAALCAAVYCTHRNCHPLDISTEGVAINLNDAYGVSKLTQALQTADVKTLQSLQAMLKPEVSAWHRKVENKDTRDFSGYLYALRVLNGVLFFWGIVGFVMLFTFGTIALYSSALTLLPILACSMAATAGIMLPYHLWKKDDFNTWARGRQFKFCSNGYEQRLTNAKSYHDALQEMIDDAKASQTWGSSIAIVSGLTKGEGDSAHVAQTPSLLNHPESSSLTTPLLTAESTTRQSSINHGDIQTTDAVVDTTDAVYANNCGIM